MMTPNSIRAYKKEIAPAQKQQLFRLYEEVLQEIARGCLDPRSLAIATLEPIKEIDK